MTSTLKASHHKEQPYDGYQLPLINNKNFPTFFKKTAMSDAVFVTSSDENCVFTVNYYDAILSGYTNSKEDIKNFSTTHSKVQEELIQIASKLNQYTHTFFTRFAKSINNHNQTIIQPEKKYVEKVTNQSLEYLLQANEPEIDLHIQMQSALDSSISAYNIMLLETGFNIKQSLNQWNLTYITHQKNPIHTSLAINPILNKVKASKQAKWILYRILNRNIFKQLDTYYLNMQPYLNTLKQDLDIENISNDLQIYG